MPGNGGGVSGGRSEGGGVLPESVNESFRGVRLSWLPGGGLLLGHGFYGDRHRSKRRLLTCLLLAWGRQQGRMWLPT